MFFSGSKLRKRNKQAYLVLHSYIYQQTKVARIKKDKIIVQLRWSDHFKYLSVKWCSMLMMINKLSIALFVNRNDDYNFLF